MDASWYNKFLCKSLPVTKALASALIDHYFGRDYFAKGRKELVEILVG